MVFKVLQDSGVETVSVVGWMVSRWTSDLDLSYLEALHESSVSRVSSLEEPDVGLLEVDLDLANEANVILDRLAEDEVTQGSPLTCVF